MRSVIALISLAALSQAAELVVFGDSWGTEGAPALDKVMKAHNISIDNHAVAGSTAQEWSLVPNKLAQWTKANADAKYVWITIGGNDAAPMLENGDSVEEISTKVAGWARKFIDPLFAAVPKIKVVAFGYDILFWDYFECIGMANSIFSRCGKHGQANFTNCANQLFYHVQDTMETLAAEYTAKGFSFEAPVLLGSFQTAGKVPGASIGKPNNDYFSPNQFTGVARLCLHANDEGFGYIFNNLWDLYFSKHEAADKAAAAKAARGGKVETAFA